MSRRGGGDRWVPHDRRGGRGGGPRQISRRPAATQSREERRQQAAVTVDRETTCPFLLRMICTRGEPQEPAEYGQLGRLAPADEVQVHTWPDATLGEIVDCIQAVRDDARASGTRFTLRHVYPDAQGRALSRELGVVVTGARSRSAAVQLGQARVRPGDFLCVGYR